MAKAKLPPGARINEGSGRVTLIFSVEEQGKTRRLSQNKILPTEPRSYSNDPAEVWAGHTRVTEFLAQKRDRGQTVRGFWEKWTDPSHHRWGEPNRTLSTITAYASRTRPFVERYGDKPLLAITPQLVERYMDDGGRYSHLLGLETFFADALRTRLIVEHPCRELARERDEAERDRRRRTRPPVPTEAQIDTLLSVASQPPYPVDFWGWLFLGIETGMRPGELDAMKWEYLDGDSYQIEEQFNHSERRFGPPKHDSFRTLLLSDVALDVIDRFRGNGSPFIFTNPEGRTHQHWTADTREHWWSKCQDPLRNLVGDLTIYNSTRHFWATMALNRWGIPLRKAAVMFGHKDGGVTMHRTYVRRDEEAAADVQAALNARPRRLDARRRLAA